MRALATIQIIKSLSPIPNADAIEKAEILGWDVVVKKNDFKVGDRVCFCEIDSILPDLPVFEFLRSKKFRIKTCKLRGCISQGIVFPISIIKEVSPSYDVSNLNIDDDITDALKIIKYDTEAELDIPEQIKKSWLSNKLSYYKWKLLGIKKTKDGNFPTHLVPKTDETRVQKMGPSLEQRVGEPIYITEKVEGTSSTFIYRRGGNWLARLFGQAYIFQVCSRNRIVYNSRSGGETAHSLMRVADTYDILNKLKKLDRNLAIQGEIIGSKIQGNIYKVPDLQLKVFLIFDLDKQAYVPYSEFVSLIKELDLPTVPLIDDSAVINNDIKYYVELSKGKSQINTGILREGIVIRSLTDNFSFKSINPEYLLKQE